MRRAADGREPVRPTDRVAHVLARDERLVEVFVRLSPAFEPLRSPAMRKTMARLVTLEQAAKMAGVPAAELVGLLNDALGGPVDSPAGRAATPSLGAAEVECGTPAGDDTAGGAADPMAPDAPAAAGASGLPTRLVAVAERIIDVDVRDALRRDEEPFSRIMAARRGPARSTRARPGSPPCWPRPSSRPSNRTASRRTR